MFKSYLISLRRNLIRWPVYTILNLSCLSLGITSVLFILLYLNFELKYDRFHSNADRIYRVETKSIKTHERVIDTEWNSTPANLGPYIQEDYPGIGTYVRLFTFWQNDQVRFYNGEKPVEEENVMAVDNTVFEVFSFDLVSGDPQTMLSGPNKIALSENLARRIFGQEDPVGKMLATSLVHNLSGVDPDYSLMVTGVYRDLPENSHMTMEAMISAETDPKLEEYYFNRFNVFTYVLLNPKVNPADLAPNLSAIYEKYLNSDREPVLVSANHELAPLTNIHMNESGGSTYIYIFASVALLLLLITGISYVNLITAQANKRSLEIGVRKVMGSHRSQLTFQFLAESLFFTLLSLAAAIGLVIIFTGSINTILGLQLDSSQLLQPALLSGMLAIVLLIGILAGSYPAFFLSAFKPVSVMKGKLAKPTPVRRSLVAVQFVVVIFVVTCTGLIYDQLQFLRNKDLGFDKEHVVMLSLPEQHATREWAVLKEALLQSPYIASTGVASFTPGTGGMRRGPVSAEGSEGEEQKFAHIGMIGYDFLATMGVEMVSGRNFSRDFPGDSTQAVIVNETFVRDFNLNGPLGKKIRFGSKGNPNFFQVVGVVKDFHQNSLYNDIEPQMFLLRPANTLAVKIRKGLPAGMRHVEKSWAKVFPNVPFDYQFLDAELQNSYEADMIRGKVFFSLSLLTIFVSFLGLFGLASYLASQRIREIGIRRALGATMRDTIALMTRDFLFLAGIAAIPAFAAAWYVVGQWLERFAFRTGINYLLFVMVLLLTLILTFVTTGLHAVRLAQLNPAKTLKHE